MQLHNATLFYLFVPRKWFCLKVKQQEQQALKERNREKKNKGIYDIMKNDICLTKQKSKGLQKLYTGSDSSEKHKCYLIIRLESVISFHY